MRHSATILREVWRSGLVVTISSRSASTSRINSKIVTSRRRRRSNSGRRWRGISRPSPVRKTARSRSHERRGGPFPNALGEQQCFNSVFDAKLLLHQVLALAVYALGILVIRRRHAYHAAALAITPKIGREHAQDAYGIEPVRLGPSGAAIDEDAGRLEHIVGDTMRRQQTVQTEPITSCLKTAHNTNRGVEPASNTGAQRRDESDLKNCPGAPEAVLRGPRMARFCHGYCTCSRVRNEVEAKGLCGGEGELVLKRCEPGNKLGGRLPRATKPFREGAEGSLGPGRQQRGH